MIEGLERERMFSSSLLYQIRQLVTSLNKSNFNTNKQELKQVRPDPGSVTFGRTNDDIKDQRTRVAEYFFRVEIPLGCLSPKQATNPPVHACHP